MLLTDFEDLAKRCAPSVAPSTLVAIAKVESGFQPYAIGLVAGRLQRQPRSVLEAISTVKALQGQQMRFSAGLMQIYVGNWAAYGLDHESAFAPCATLRAAADILSKCFERSQRTGVGEQIALRHALSCYYSNNFTTGYADGYVHRVVGAATAARDGRPASNPSGDMPEGSKPTRAIQR